MLLRFLISCFLLGPASLALGSPPAETFIERSPMRVVGSSLIDDNTAEMLAAENSELQCYRSFQHNSLLRKLKCRATQSQDILAEKLAD